MIIKKIIIYGYGKWVDTEFEINRPFHLFFGENEAGKSTLMSFIHSIFFGFPTRHSSASRYEPRESSRYGGKIIIQDKRYGTLSIERVSGKVTGDVTVQFEDGSTADEAVLSTLFYGKSRHFFESIYSFDLKGIENIQELNKEQLNRFFLSVGALGHEKYLKQADQYHSQAEKLFKPMGRKPKINQLQIKLKEKKQTVDSAKRNNDSYIKLIQDNLSKQKQLESLERNIEETTEELQYLNEISKYQETIEEAEMIRKKLKEIPDLELPEEGLYQLKQYNSDIQSFQQNIDELQNKQKSLQHQYKPSKEFVMFHQNEEESAALEKDMDVWEDKVQELQFTRKDLTNIREAMTEIKIRENIVFSGPIPQELSASERTYLNDTKKQIVDLDKQISALEEEARELKYRIGINDEMIDNIEPKLVSLSKYNELVDLEKATEQGHVTTKNDSKKSMYPLLSVFAVLVTIYLFSIHMLYAFGFALLFILSMTLISSKRKKHTEIFSKEQQNMLLSQTNLRKQWKELLAANDEYQSLKEESISQLENLKTMRFQLNQDFDSWKRGYNYPDHTTIFTISEKSSIYQRLRELQKEELELVRRLKNSENKINSRLMSFEQSFDRPFIADDIIGKFKEMKGIFREVKREEREMKDYIKKTDVIQHEINYYVDKVNEIKKSKRNFFESINASNEEQVYELYAIKKDKEEKEARLSTLMERLPVNTDSDLQDQLDHMSENIEKLKVQHKTFTNEHNVLLKKIMEIEMKIRHLEDGGTYTELLQEYENQKSYYQEAVDQWSRLKTAAGIIEKTLHYAKEDKLPQALAIAEEYFSFLTNGKYPQLIFENDYLYTLDEEGKKWGSEELSRGTVEPLYISLRLAFIKVIKNSIQFPIIIDDPFVNLDSLRAEKMYELLTDFDKEIQIIYFSFDPRIHSFIEEDKCVYLTNYNG